MDPQLAQQEIKNAMWPADIDRHQSKTRSMNWRLDAKVDLVTDRLLKP